MCYLLKPVIVTKLLFSYGSSVLGPYYILDWMKNTHTLLNDEHFLGGPRRLSGHST